MTATWGTCNRCGATIAIELERAGVPVAFVSAVPAIPMSLGVPRVVRGVAVTHILGDPALPPGREAGLRRRPLETAVQALAHEVSGPTRSEPGSWTPCGR